MLISLNLNESDVLQPGNQTAKAPALESASAATGPTVLFWIAKKPQKLGVQPSTMDKQFQVNLMTSCVDSDTPLEEV